MPRHFGDRFSQDVFVQLSEHGTYQEPSTLAVIKEHPLRCWVRQLFAVNLADENFLREVERAVAFL
jgi:hypothetical protein